MEMRCPDFDAQQHAGARVASFEFLSLLRTSTWEVFTSNLFDGTEVDNRCIQTAVFSHLGVMETPLRCSEAQETCMF